MNKSYLPPSKRNIINKKNVVDITSEQLFPSLSMTTTNKLKNVISWNKLNDIDNDDSTSITDDDTETYKMSNKEFFKTAFNSMERLYNYRRSIAFDEFIRIPIDCRNGDSYDTLCDWIDSMFEYIFKAFYKHGYVFSMSEKKVKSTVLHWLFTIHTMSPHAVNVEFAKNPWIIPGKKLRRSEDISAFNDLFPEEFWKCIYMQWGSEDIWFFNLLDSRGKISYNDLPYILYSKLDLNASDITEEITRQLDALDEKEAAHIVFDARYRNNLEYADELNDIMRGGSGEADNLRGDRRHDIW